MVPLRGDEWTGWAFGFVPVPYVEPDAEVYLFTKALSHAHTEFFFTWWANGGAIAGFPIRSARIASSSTEPPPPLLPPPPRGLCATPITAGALASTLGRS